MRCEVITVSPSRWNEFISDWRRSIHLIEPKRWWGTLGDDLALPPNWQPPLNAAAYGCTRSHQSLWFTVEGPTLVFEDDAVLVDDFEERLLAVLKHAPDDWDVIYLGGETDRRSSPVPVAPGLVEGGWWHRTHAYVLRGNESAMRALDATRGLPMHLDAALIEASKSGAIKAYAATPWLAGQRAGWSSIMRRDEPERWWT
jgi:glycosyl transferase family 25